MLDTDEEKFRLEREELELVLDELELEDEEELVLEELELVLLDETLELLEELELLLEDGTDTVPPKTDDCDAALDTFEEAALEAGAEDALLTVTESVKRMTSDPSGEDRTFFSEELVPETATVCFFGSSPTS